MSASAWTPTLGQCLARDARRLVPRTLAQLMNRREAEIARELERFPPEVLQAISGDLATAGALQPATLVAFDNQANEAVQLLRNQQISEGVVRLAGLLRIPAELCDPITTGGSAHPPGLSREYYAFIEASLGHLPVTLVDPAALQLPRRGLRQYWLGLVEQSRPHAEVLRTELFQRGRVVDHRTIDYRSPVFGVAQIAYSRAVTAVAATWTALWREARGDVTRFPQTEEVLPQDRGPQSELLDAARPARRPETQAAGPRLHGHNVEAGS